MTKPKNRPIFVLADQLVQTWIRNDADLAKLEELRRRRERGHAYMREPGCNWRLATAYLERVEEAKRVHLFRLRAGRRKALELMARATRELESGKATRAAGSSARSATSCSAPPIHQPKVRKYA